ELGGEATHIAHRVVGAARALHGGKAHEHRCGLVRKHGGLGVFGGRIIRLKITMGAGAARMHDALGDALVVEVIHLLTVDESLHQRRAALAGLELVVVIGDAHPLVGAQILVLVMLAIACQILVLAVRIYFGIVAGGAAIGFGKGVAISHVGCVVGTK